MFQTQPEFRTDFFKHDDEISPSWWCWIVNSWKLKAWYCFHQRKHWRISCRSCRGCWLCRCYFRFDIAYFSSTPNLKIRNCCICRRIVVVREPKLSWPKRILASYFMKTHHCSIYLKYNLTIWKRWNQHYLYQMIKSISRNGLIVNHLILESIYLLKYNFRSTGINGGKFWSFDNLFTVVTKRCASLFNVTWLIKAKWIIKITP